MESGLVLRPPGLCPDCLWGTALSCPFHVSIGQPLGKQPLGRGSRALCLPPAWPVLCCGRWNPPLLSPLCPLALPAPTATSAFAGAFLLESLEAGTGAHKMSIRGRQERTDGGLPDS